MLHLIIDCPERLVEKFSAKTLMYEVFEIAREMHLFNPGDIKVRIQPYQFFSAGNIHCDFIHIFGYIIEGRTTEQKADLSKRIITKLKSMFPDVPVISMNVMDFEKATYCNRNLIL